MSRTPTCGTIDSAAIASRYAAGTLGPEEEVAFEEHYVVCADCQEEVRLAVAVRQAIAGPRPSEAGTMGDAAGATGRAGTDRGWWLGVAGVAAAAVVALVILRPAVMDPTLRDLGGVGEPPVYLGVPVRSVGPEDAAFERGMDAYAQGRWDQAEELLADAAGGEGAEAPARFFLGVSLLMQDRPEEAEVHFRAVLDLGDTPYREEAGYYLAKALLRLGRGDEAVEALRSVKTADHPFAGSAGALADSVVSVLGR